MTSLTIGVVPGVTPDRWLRAWRDRSPGAPLVVVPLEVAEAVDALGGRADMVFTRLPVAGADALHVIPLWEETPVAVAARDHPLKAFATVTLADLAGEERYEGAGDEVLDLVAAGHGVTVLPQSVFRATGRRDLLARPVEDAEPTRIALVWRRADGGELIDAFIGVVRGRTENSSRGTPTPPTPPPARPKRPRPAAERQPGRTRRPRRG